MHGLTSMAQSHHKYLFCSNEDVTLSVDSAVTDQVNHERAV